MVHTREPAVAEIFYPFATAELAATVDGLLAACPPSGAPTPKALIAPHAGYSGAVAASANARLAPDARNVSRVVLLGPAHRVPFRGLALPGVDALGTPLGSVALGSVFKPGIVPRPVPVPDLSG